MITTVNIAALLALAKDVKQSTTKAKNGFDTALLSLGVSGCHGKKDLKK